jgi:pyridoxine kinase
MAHYLTPNMWELDRLSPGPLEDAARRLRRPVLATSVEAGEEEIGLAYVDADGATLFAHRRLPTAPNGLGDLVTAVFGARLLSGDEPREAAKAAALAVSHRMQAGELRRESLA